MELRDRDSCVSTILGEVSNVLMHPIEHVDRVSYARPLHIGRFQIRQNNGGLTSGALS
jgi:hypothetical protein